MGQIMQSQATNFGATMKGRTGGLESEGSPDKAVACLTKDKETLLAFFWDHLRTSNPIESVFATVRHRTVRKRELCLRRPPSSWYSNSSMPPQRHGGD